MKENQARAAERLSRMANYRGHYVRDGEISYVQSGRVAKKALAGAVAEYESGADQKRPTLTRIGAGAILAGPFGAVAGGMLRKNKTKGYVTILFQDGDTLIIEGPVKEEPAMRQFAADVNRLAST